LTLARLIPEPRPRATIATNSPASRATVGVTRNGQRRTQTIALFEGDLADGPGQHEHDRQEYGQQCGPELRRTPGGVVLGTVCTAARVVIRLAG